jgi:HAD superfamily hydrolase (TIGR01549 family)
MIKVIIFDFDGVIVESVGIKADGFAMIYEPYGKVVVEKVVNHHYENGGVSRYEKFCYCHKKFLGINLKNAEIEDLGKRFADYVVEKIIRAPYVKGAFEFLEKYNGKYDMFISTGTPQDEIEMITRLKNINKYFIDIYGSPKKKSNHIENILSTNHYRREQVVFIGDSVEDKKAAMEQQLMFIARSEAGNKLHSNEKYKIKNLYELKDVLMEFN